MAAWEERYRKDMRNFLESDRVLTIVDPNRGYRFDGEAEDENVSPYGYSDYSATEHLWKCGTASLEGAEVYERTYSMFQGTFVDNEDEVGINVKYVSCQCGKVKNRYGRWQGSFADLINHLTGGKDAPASFTL